MNSGMQTHFASDLPEEACCVPFPKVNIFSYNIHPSIRLLFRLAYHGLGGNRVMGVVQMSTFRCSLWGPMAFLGPLGATIPPAHLGSGQVSPPVCHALYTLKGRYSGGMINRCTDPLRTLLSVQGSRGWTLRTSQISELLS